MSTDDEIRAVYEADIKQKSRIVFSNKGIWPFLEGLQGWSNPEELNVFELLPNLSYLKNILKTGWCDPDITDEGVGKHASKRKNRGKRGKTGV